MVFFLWFAYMSVFRWFGHVCLYVDFPLVWLCGVFLLACLYRFSFGLVLWCLFWVADMSVSLWFWFCGFPLVCLAVGFPLVWFGLVMLRFLLGSFICRFSVGFG